MASLYCTIRCDTSSIDDENQLANYSTLEYDTIQDQRRRQCSIFHSTHCPLFKQCSIFLNPLFYSALFSTAVLYLPGVNTPICSEFNYKIHAMKHKQLSFYYNNVEQRLFSVLNSDQKARRKLDRRATPLAM